uniref:Uncharacterized protein n=1 Tax=Arundo donax TaxID=35708 RepID=A0A0A9A305_ARUDO
MNRDINRKRHQISITNAKSPSLNSSSSSGCPKPCDKVIC